MAPIQVRVKIEHKQLVGWLDKGDVVTLENRFGTITHTIYGKGHDGILTSRKYELPNQLIEGYRFMSVNGEYYTDENIRGAIGYASLGEIFEKV